MNAILLLRDFSFPRSFNLAMINRELGIYQQVEVEGAIC